MPCGRVALRISKACVNSVCPEAQPAIAVSVEDSLGAEDDKRDGGSHLKVVGPRQAESSDSLCGQGGGEGSQWVTTRGAMQHPAAPPCGRYGRMTTCCCSLAVAYAWCHRVHITLQGLVGGIKAKIGFVSRVLVLKGTQGPDETATERRGCPGEHQRATATAPKLF